MSAIKTVSYQGMTPKELRELHKQWKRGKGRYRCELGHDGCGATNEITQDGQAPCARELLHEMAWRGLIDTNDAEVES